MRIKQVQVYRYNELSDKAKQKARDWFLRGLDFQFEWDCIKDDAKSIGLELAGMNRGSMKGEFIESARDCANKILKNHGESGETYKTAFKFMQELFVAEKKYEQTGSEKEKEELQAQFLLDILEDYRIMTDRQEEYCMSEEYIMEAMEANEYEFTENGNPA